MIFNFIIFNINHWYFHVVFHKFQRCTALLNFNLLLILLQQLEISEQYPLYNRYFLEVSCCNLILRKQRVPLREDKNTYGQTQLMKIEAFS